MRNNNYLYRGVNINMHDANKGLFPKGTSLSRVLHLDEGFHLDSGTTFDSSKENAVIAHQKNSNKYPTSGVSTTPHFNRARFYATNNNTINGVVYKIERDRLAYLNVLEHVVSDYTPTPEVPIDDEVILVHRDGGPLPLEIIEKIFNVSPNKSLEN